MRYEVGVYNLREKEFECDAKFKSVVDAKEWCGVKCSEGYVLDSETGDKVYEKDDWPFDKF